MPKQKPRTKLRAGKSALKPFDPAVIQCCPVCGKIDAYEGDHHDCAVEAYRQESEASLWR